MKEFQNSSLVVNVLNNTQVLTLPQGVDGALGRGRESNEERGLCSTALARGDRAARNANRNSRIFCYLAQAHNI